MCSAWASSCAGGVEHRGRAVGSFLDVGTERGALQHRAHLVGDPAEPGDQDLQRRRRPGSSRRRLASRGRATRAGLRDRSSRRAPRSCSPRGPRPPDRPPARPAAVPAGQHLGDRARRRRLGHGPQRDDLDRVVAAVAVATLVLGGELGDGRHPEVVALPGVPAVDRGRDRARLDAERRHAPSATRASSSALVERRRASAPRRPAPHQLPVAGRDQQPDRRQDAGRGRDDHGASCPSTRPAHTRATVPRRRTRRARARPGRRRARPTPARSACSIPAFTTAMTPVGVDAGRVERGPRHAASRSGRCRVSPCRRWSRRGSGRQRGWRRSPSGRYRRGRSTPGPDRRRPMPGPTTSAPPASMRAMLPPPAPMVWMSSEGSRTGKPATACSAVTAGAPSRIRHTSVLVPPMSKLSASGKPQARPPRPRPARPPAGPESSSAAGSSAPLLDVEQAAGRRHDHDLVGGVGQAAQVRAAHRPECRVDDGRDRALVLAHLG